MLRALPISLATIFVASLAIAQETTAPSEFHLWDLDEDKIVTLTELENRLLAVFTQYDKDGDGALDTEEYNAFDAGREAEAAKHKTSLTLRAVTGLSRGYTDTNFDGRVTRDELLSAGREWFNGMDRNKDGQIDAQDFPSASDFTKSE